MLIVIPGYIWRDCCRENDGLSPQLGKRPPHSDLKFLVSRDIQVGWCFLHPTADFRELTHGSIVNGVALALCEYDVGRCAASIVDSKNQLAFAICQQTAYSNAGCRDAWLTAGHCTECNGCV